MTRLGQILAPCAEWSQPRTVEGNPFRLVCRLYPAKDQEELRRVWAGIALPEGISELWGIYRSGTLFEDVDYGQWGLELLSPVESAASSAGERSERPDDFGSDDVVLGKFLGDQDLLVIDGAGRVLVALPLDKRADWFRPAATLDEFLSRYVAMHGEKYWEKTV